MICVNPVVILSPLCEQPPLFLPYNLGKPSQAWRVLYSWDQGFGLGGTQETLGVELASSVVRFIFQTQPTACGAQH